MKPHEALITATSPAWSEATDDGSIGVDYLGTRAVNLEMLTRLTGAYNNVVLSARQHAIMCWAAWRYRENCRAAGTDLKSDQFRDFFDAVETIQLVGQHELGEQFGGRTGGLGSDALRHLGDNPIIPLRFKKYGRSHANTSALAAVQYGPSAKPGSFDLLASGSKIWWPTTRGEKLALALDPLMRGSATYDRLAQFPVPGEIERAAAIDLAARGLVIGEALPERPERAPYIEALFDLDDHPVAADHERRLTLALLLEVVGALGDDCATAAIRQALLSGHRRDGTPLVIPAYLARTAARWQLLQLRQLQRYALEAWLFWVEWHMPGTGEDFVEAVADVLAHTVAPHDDLASLLSRPAGVAVPEFLQHRRVANVLPWAATGALGSPWALRAEIGDALSDEEPVRAVPAVLGLTLSVLALAEQLVDARDEHGFAAIGARRRISMLHFKMWWQRRADVALREVLVDLLEELVLQQHVAVAVARFDNEQRRLRFSNDETGWVALPGSEPAVPRLTPDRIEALLTLMADLALVETADGAFSINEAGRLVLGRVAERIATETVASAP